MCWYLVGRQGKELAGGQGKGLGKRAGEEVVRRAGEGVGMRQSCESRRQTISSISRPTFRKI